MVAIIRGQILEMPGSIKTTMMEFFEDRYAAIAETVVFAASATMAAASVGTRQVFQYQDFDNMKPLNFDGV